MAGATTARLGQIGGRRIGGVTVGGVAARWQTWRDLHQAAVAR